MKKIKNGISKIFSFSLKILTLSSFLLSQLFISEILLYKNNNNNISLYNINTAQADTSDTWYNTAYSYRKEITIDHTKVPNTDQSNFPILVSLTDTSLKTTANGGKIQNTNGYDIIFANQDGDTKLDHEIESYAPTTGAIVMWVKIPLLSASEDTIIYIYYGNPNITTSQEDKEGLWDDGGDNNFKMVQHMNQDPSGTAPQMIDSTQYNNDGTSGGTMTSGDVVSGKINGATDFDGGDDYINAGDGSNLKINNNISISFWVKTTTATYGMILDKKNVEGYFFSMNSSGIITYFIYDGSLPYIEAPSASAMNDGAWHYVSATRNTINNAVKLYIDGVEDNSVDASTLNVNR